MTSNCSNSSLNSNAVELVITTSQARYLTTFRIGQSLQGCKNEAYLSTSLCSSSFLHAYLNSQIVHCREIQASGFDGPIPDFSLLANLKDLSVLTFYQIALYVE